MLRCGCGCEVYGVDRLVGQLESLFGTLLSVRWHNGEWRGCASLTMMKFCKVLVSNHWVTLKELFITEKISKLFITGKTFVDERIKGWGNLSEHDFIN